MRDFLRLTINRETFEIRGDSVFSTLSDFLRADLQRNGTKVVCAEGDCGACTVLVGRPGTGYQPVDACILFLYQIDGAHVITIEGLGTSQDLHPVQQAMVDHHGSQCGYCTPGFVMAMAGMFESSSQDNVRTALTGNLCRCTGYLPILEAAELGRIPLPSLTERFPLTVEDDGVEIQQPRRFYAPKRLEEALDFKARHANAVIISGGTELGVLRNKQGLESPVLLSLTKIPGLGDITTSPTHVTIGANATWTQVEKFAKESLPEFYPIVIRFGSPQIRNVATLVGNVANGSPIADSLPFLFVMEAELELACTTGRRWVKIHDFYKGYKVKDLGKDEIITQVRFPLPSADEDLKLYKISRRNDLDIATFGAGIRVLRHRDSILRAHVAYSGVAATVLRLPATERFLQGKAFSEATFREAGRVARSEIQPITDVRGSRDFRLTLAENILTKFWFDCEEKRPAHGHAR